MKGPMVGVPGTIDFRSMLRAALRRLPGMAAVWLTFGVVVGVLTATERNTIAVVAGAVAGAIVLTPLGLSLVLIGGRVLGSLAGGAFGLACSPLIVELGAMHGGRSVAAFGIVAGGLFGATVVVAISIARRLFALATAPDDRR